MTSLLYYKNVLSTKKKLLNQILFNKSFIRNSLGSQFLYTIDNYSNFSIFKNYKKVKSLTVGRAINSSLITFINRLNKDICFQMNTCSFGQETNNIFENLDKILSSNLKTTKLFNRLLFLKILKGGFRCYYFGVIGFIPKKHVIRLFFQFLILVSNTYQDTEEKDISNFLGIIKISKIKTNPYCFQSSGIIIRKLNIFPQIKKKFFSKGSTSFKRSGTGLNTVFVTTTDKKV